VATYGEAVAQRWRCAARRARELILTRWRALRRRSGYRRLQPGGPVLGARQERAGSRGAFPACPRSAQDRDQEIERLRRWGAPGQHRADWRRVLDRPGRPEGNESCVIRPKETLTREGSTPGGADRPCPRQMSTFSRRSDGACLCELTYHSSHQTWADRAASRWRAKCSRP